MKLAILREIDDIARAGIEENTKAELSELDRSRRRAGLPKLPQASSVQLYLQKLVGSFQLPPNAQVLDMVRESVCHRMIKNTSRALKLDPQNEECKIRLELIYAITAEIEDRVLRVQKGDFSAKTKKLEKKYDALYQRGMKSGAILKRVEKKVVEREALAESRGWAIDGNVKIAFKAEIFDPLEKQIAELEKLNDETERMIVSLPAVDPDALSAKELRALSISIDLAIHYFFSARKVITAALNNLQGAAQKSVGQIGLWQERKTGAEQSENNAQIQACLEFVDGYEDCLVHQRLAIDKVEKYLQDQDTKLLRLARAKQFIQEKLSPS